MKKKLLSVLLALTLTASCLTACGDSSSTAGSDDNSTKKAETWQTTTSATTTAAKVEVNELVYSSDKVKIYYTGGEKLDANNKDGYTGLALDFRVENGYDEKVKWYISKMEVNGISITVSDDEFIDAKSTEACRILVREYPFETAKIKEYSEVKLKDMFIQGEESAKRYEKNISFTVKV